MYVWEPERSGPSREPLPYKRRNRSSQPSSEKGSPELWDAPGIG